MPFIATASAWFWCCRDLANFETVSSFLTTFTHLGKRSVYIRRKIDAMKAGFET